MEDIELKTFPSSNIEALALLYVQNQDLKGKTPAEIHTMYQVALYEIKQDWREKRNNGYFRDHR